ncbi:MAG: sigma-70 family RNA polymerase sigma factor [Bacteroidota bacterium]
MKRRETSFSEQEIVQGLKKGGQSAERMLAYMYRTYREQVLIRLQQYSASEAEAADVFQDGIIQILMAVQQGKFRGDSSLKTYLSVVCRNLWFKQIRSKDVADRYVQKVDTPEADFESPEWLLLEDDQLTQVQSFLDQLKVKCKEVLNLWARHYSMKEIAETLGYQNAQVVRNKKNQCLKEVKHMLAQNPLIQSWLSELYV